MIELETPIISAIRNEKELERAVKSPTDAVFVLQSNIINCKKYIDLCHSAGKKVFFHYDFLDGYGKDRCGLKHFKTLGADGIISTKSNIICWAREEGLVTVQRFFIVDSKSVYTALETIKETKPDMVDLMPGIIPSAIKRFVSKTDTRVIAGGLVTTKEEIIETLKAGAYAVSTSKEELWFS